MLQKFCLCVRFGQEGLHAKEMGIGTNTSSVLRRETLYGAEMTCA